MHPGHDGPRPCCTDVPGPPTQRKRYEEAASQTVVVMAIGSADKTANHARSCISTGTRTDATHRTCFRGAQGRFSVADSAAWFNKPSLGWTVHNTDADDGAPELRNRADDLDG